MSRKRKLKPVADPLNPDLTVLVKLASIAVHAEEMLSSGSHAFDVAALRTLLVDTDVKEWLASMDPALLPVKRR